MKKITSLLVAFFAIIALVGCKPDKAPVDSAFKLSETNVKVTMLGGQSTVKLNAPGAWRTAIAEDAKAWLKLDPSNGGGGVNQVITILSTEMVDGQTTSGKITFSLVDGSIPPIELIVERVDATPSRQTDSLALVALWNSAGGSKWTLNRWNFKKSIRDWGGVNTVLINGEWRVNQILLGGENLNGTITEALATMSELQVINFGREYWNESNKPKYLLTGQIPDAVCKIPKLETFDVSFHDLQGPINPGFFRPGMKHVVLSGNKMGGTIPEEVGLATDLVYLRLNMCNVTGAIPRSISNLTNLEVIDFDYNRLTGVIPSFNASKKLFVVRLAAQCETETVTVEYNDGIIDYMSGKPRAFTYEKYVSGGFTGSELVFEDMPDLDGVGLIRTNITTTPVFKNCPKVTLFACSDNPNLKTIDPSILQLPNLKSFQASNCGLTSLPEQINLPKLQEFYVYNNKITKLPESMGNMPQIQWLYLNDNLIENLPNVFDKFPLLIKVYAAHCKLKTVPETLWDRTTLIELELHNNEIEGELPASLGAFSTIGIFTIANNKLTGPMTGLATLKSAQQIFAHNNQFSGKIPDGTVTVPGSDLKPTIGSLAYAKYLTLANNNLDGEIPAALQRCTELNYLTLSGNKLSGVIPKDVISMGMGRKWCGFSPETNIIPQQSPYAFEGYVNPCK